MITHADYARRILNNIVKTDDDCWLWQGYTLPSGWGQIGRNLMTHRVVWEYLREPIPAGMTLDHECHNRDASCNLGVDCLHRRCVNPAHLAVKTIGDNTLAGRTPSALNAVKTHCTKGHQYTEANTYYRPNRWGRYCRICQADANARCRSRQRELNRQRSREWRARKREERRLNDLRARTILTNVASARPTTSDPLGGAS